jgi:hypothetical protein
VRFGLADPHAHLYHARARVNSNAPYADEAKQARRGTGFVIRDA